MKRADRTAVARRTGRRLALASMLVVVTAAPAAADEEPAVTPSFVRPEAAEMGEGGWTEPAEATQAAVGTAENAGAGVSAEGIQRELEEQLVAGVPRPRIDLDIEFEFNSAELTESGRSDLDAAGEAMSRYFTDKRFVLGGHTDASGPAEYNLQLSRSRAQSARRYLVEVHGISPARLDAKGYGEARPIENGPPERNRRVVLELVR